MSGDFDRASSVEVLRQLQSRVDLSTMTTDYLENFRIERKNQNDVCEHEDERGQHPNTFFDNESHRNKNRAEHPEKDDGFNDTGNRDNGCVAQMEPQSEESVQTYGAQRKKGHTSGQPSAARLYNSSDTVRREGFLADVHHFVHHHRRLPYKPDHKVRECQAAE